METTNEIDASNKTDNNTLIELKEDIKELNVIFKDLEEICPSLYRVKFDGLKRHTPEGYTLPRL